MAVKKLTDFKRLAIVGVVLLGFLAIANWAAGTGSSNSYAVVVAQNETQTATDEKNAPSSQGKESETQTDEKKESTDATQKALKDFQPSEQIEAEQAVDFPYDI